MTNNFLAIPMVRYLYPPTYKVLREPFRYRTTWTFESEVYDLVNGRIPPHDQCHLLLD